MSATTKYILRQIETGELPRNAFDMPESKPVYECDRCEDRGFYVTSIGPSACRFCDTEISDADWAELAEKYNL